MERVNTALYETFGRQRDLEIKKIAYFGQCIISIKQMDSPFSTLFLYNETRAGNFFPETYPHVNKLLDPFTYKIE